jgi:hypothetical protein
VETVRVVRTDGLVMKQEPAPEWLSNGKVTVLSASQVAGDVPTLIVASRPADERL